MSKKVINIGDISKNPNKYKRQIETDLTIEKLKEVIDRTIQEPIDETTIMLKCNEINQFFESGTFYNQFYFMFSDALTKMNCTRVSSDGDVHYVFDLIYELDMTPVLKESTPDYEKSLLIRYTCGIYKEGGYRSYITDVLGKLNMVIQYFSLYDVDDKINMHMQILLYTGELFDKLEKCNSNLINL